VSWKQTGAVIVGVAVLCAALVWWLEEFNRKRMMEEWDAWLKTLPQAPPPA